VSESFLLGSVNVGLAATHSHRNDLQVDLESPTGVRVRLLTDDGVSGNNARNYDVLLSDAAGSAYSDAGDDNPATPWGGFVRSARPAQPLRAFVGLSSQGQWKLTVCDANPAQNAVAYLNSRLVLYPQAALTIPSAGNWAYTLFADGKLDSVVRTVSFYGVDLAGNRTTEPLVTSYTLDNVAPVITVTDVVNTALYSASLTVLTGTVTDGGGVSAMLVSVEGDQAVYQDIAEQEGNTWRYVMHPMTPGRYTLHVSAFDAVGNVTTVGPFEVNVQTPVHSVIYLPLISRNYVYAPDLVVKQLLVSSSAIQVIVENQGAAPVVDEFWVDVYINPTTPPVRVNQTWNQLGTQGLVWGVTSPALPALTPGGVLTLTVGDAYYQPTLSRVSWPLPSGTPVYAQADSADASTTYGAVLEIHEINGDPYNNISGPVLPAALDLLSLPANDALQAASSPHLPRRP